MYFSCSKSASTPRTLAVHWEVAWTSPKPKSVDPVDTCFFCNGIPHMACHERKVLHSALHASIFCQSEICVGLRQFLTAKLAMLLFLLLPLLLLLLLLLLLTPVLVCPLLLLLLLLTPVVVCGSVASDMLCLLNIPKMLMVN